MTILVSFHVSGATAERYETVLARLEAAGIGASPAGQLYHVAYGSPDNLQVIDVFDSQESFERFGQALAPLLAELGITARPEVHAVHRILTPVSDGVAA